MGHQSWSSGGTADVLPAERARCSFDVGRMMGILDGDKKSTFQRQWIQSSHDDIAEDSESSIPKVEVHADMERGKVVHDAMKHFMDIHWKHLQRGYKPKDQDMTFMSNARFGQTGPLALHFGVFMSTLRSQGSDEQQSWWLEKAQRLGIIGCYAQTELGHGSNVRGLQTTAEFSPHGGPEGDGEWILNTPTLQSTKWWATGMPSATHCALYAQMILKGKAMGVHVFFVQLRGGDLRALPGIEIGDLGAKLGDNDAPIGYLRLKDVHIPRRHLFERRQHVLSDGTFVRGPPQNAKGAVAGEGPKSAAKSQKGGDKSHYITMMKTRVALTNTAGSALAKACTIGARYSAVRHQGFKDTAAGVHYAAEEHPILDYQVQLFRVLKSISCAYAIKFVARWLLERRKAAEKSDEGNDDLPEVHASAAGLKAYGCVLAADCIEDLRRACGGHGYMMASGIAPLEADFKGPNTTAEGDYVILLLQTARFLLKQVDTARSGRTHLLPGLTACLAPLGDPSFDPVLHGKPTPVATVSELIGEGKKSRHHLLDLFKYRALVACDKASATLKQHMSSSSEMSLDRARNSNARLLYATSISHVKYFMMSKFVEAIDSMDVDETDSCKAVLNRLAILFGLQDIIAGDQWVGLLSAQEMTIVDAGLSELCQVLRDDVIGLTDAFDIPDRVLNSALGRSDGRVYEALYESAKTSSLNVDSSGSVIDVPAFFDAVRGYLDFDFLSKGQASSASKL